MEYESARSKSSRRALMATVPTAAVLAACGAGQTGMQTAPSTQQPAPSPTAAVPKEFMYVKPANVTVDEHWKALFANATKATGVKATLLTEPGGAPFWEKRQNEFAAGTPVADATYNQNNWVLIGGLKGMFVDHAPLMARDRVDPSQYLKIELESWRWKNKQYAIPFQSGGEAVMLNKQIFAEKGVPLPPPTWTYDDLVAIGQRLHEPGSNLAAVIVGQNGIQYMAGTFMRNFGGQVLNQQRNRAVYADDVNSLRGAELNVDLHQKHKLTPSKDLLSLVPGGSSAFRSRMAAIQIDYVGYTAAVTALGEEAVDILPPPKGPNGHQTARVVGNAWSILSQSKHQDAAWTVLRWFHTREGFLGSGAPLLDAIGWPPILWAAESPQWMERFKGTRAADLQKVWATTGHNQVVLPEGDLALREMNPPWMRAVNGEIGVREALRESQDKVNVLFAQRPAEWEQ